MTKKSTEAIPCWAHLFDEETIGLETEPEDRAESSETTALGTGPGQMVDLDALVNAATAPGAAWTHQSDDLNVNLLVFASGEGIAEHVNAEVDVLLVGIEGTGAVTIDGTRQILMGRTRDSHSQRYEPGYPEYERPLRLPHLSPPPRRSWPRN